MGELQKIPCGGFYVGGGLRVGKEYKFTDADSEPEVVNNVLTDGTYVLKLIADVQERPSDPSRWKLSIAPDSKITNDTLLEYLISPIPIRASVYVGFTDETITFNDSGYTGGVEIEGNRHSAIFWSRLTDFEIIKDSDEESTSVMNVLTLFGIMEDISHFSFYLNEYHFPVFQHER